MTILLVRDGPEEPARHITAAIIAAFPQQVLRTIAKDQPIAEPATAVVVRWNGRPTGLAPLRLALTFVRQQHRVYWVDDDGRLGRCGLGFFAYEGARWFGFVILDGLVKTIARLLCHATPPSVICGHSADRQGQTVVLVPVLPDLSHTFVYREILALLAQRPNWRVVCLSRSPGPVHAEAKALAAHAAWLPPAGVLRRCACILGWMRRAPRRVGALLALYRQRPGGRLGDLFGKLPLRDPCHPGRCFALASALRGQPLRHLHVYSSTYPANVALGAAILLDVPFSITSYVDFDFDYDFKMLEPKLRLARFFRVCTQACRQRLIEQLQLRDAAKIPVVVFGLDLTQWSATAVAPGSGMLVTAARLVEKKGLHLVPQALARLRQRGVTFRWLVLGDGPELPRLRALVSEYGLQDLVEFRGPAPNDQVRAELQRADLALLPCVIAGDGDRDGIPVFITESMALGVPVLTTAVAGIPEVVRQDDTGFFAAPGSSADLATQLEAILADGPRRAAVARRGREFVHTTQDVRQSAAAVLALLEAPELP